MQYQLQFLGFENLIFNKIHIFFLNAGYNYHKREYARLSELRDEALSKGNTALAGELYLSMEKEQYESEECLKTAEKLTNKLSERLKISVTAIIINVLFLTLYIVFVIRYNRNNNSEEVLKKQRRKNG